MEEKSPHAKREEQILEYWKKNNIFEKTLKKNKDSGKEFVFFEGPPTANGRPGIHHLEARAFKDAIPRYKTMRGFYVRRKGGWDTHGLPVELAVEKELGLKSKKEIESYGIKAFNEKCKASVWTYVHEWEDFTNRMGYWVDLKDPYITYKPNYIESIWNIVKTVEQKNLLYKDYKVVPWCPRCGTGLSSHELAQGYEDVKDLSVYAKFKVKTGTKIAGVSSDDKTFIVAWTTTPWTLPGNVGLAVGESIGYTKVKVGEETLIFATARLSVINVPYTKVSELKGSDLVGVEYEPLYPFLKDNITGAEKDKLKNAYKVYAADFVTVSDGTGIVHTAVMYGQEDFELGNKVGLPKYHLVNDDGTFKKEAGFLAQKFVKEEGVDVEIIKDLAHRGLLFHKEKHEHSYPFCWRCHTPLIYFARDSWYIRMSKLRHDLVKENEGIHWEPEHIREGRFGEWLREVKDWAISRERYWGTPLPVWHCEVCHGRRVVGSVAEVTSKPRNTYTVIRHGEAENNVQGILDSLERDRTNPAHLSELGRKQVQKSAESLKGQKFDLVFVSPLVRTQETKDILQKTIGFKDDIVKTDDRLQEMGLGVFNGQSIEKFYKEVPFLDRFEKGAEGGETYADIKKRMGDFLYDMESKYEGKNILIVSHETPIFLIIAAAMGLDRKTALEFRGQKDFIKNAEYRKLDFKVIPHNGEYELDLHRPYIDEVKLKCKCGGDMKRVKEVMDVWFDSGAMPFAQEHYPFEKTKGWFGREKIKPMPYPADFISEAIDQTRGWFYTLHAIGALMGRGKAFKNVICLGHILDAKGKKMSKSIGNVINPWDMMNKYGADALRYWMYSVNQPGDSKNFDEKTVDEIIKKVLNLATNVTTFYNMYADPKVAAGRTSTNVLDKWIIARLDEVVTNVTGNMDKYVFLESTRTIRDFVGDLSQWYIRRSRDRFKEDGKDKTQALSTTKYVLLTLAKILAPFMPFYAEFLYQELGVKSKSGEFKESVHLEAWPEVVPVNKKCLEDMALVREVASRGLEARMSAKINVRQPLSTLMVKNEKVVALGTDLLEVIKDEINVKKIAFDASINTDFALDTNLTPELKAEGDLRELLRKIQDMRKEKGLTVHDVAKLIVSADMKDIVSKNENEIKAAARISDIEYGDVFALKA